MKLKSFGCSFLYGSELQDRDCTWPGIVARQLGLPHYNYSIEGAGNLRIMESILSHADANDICIVNWTWIDRFDYINSETESWRSIVPSDSDTDADFYFRRFHSQYRDMLTSLIYTKTALDHMDSQNCRCLMTFMDDLMFESVQDNWHHSAPITNLQQYLRPRMTTFYNLSFLQWSRANGFAESPRWHPLDEAHGQAAELMLPIIESILRKA